MASNHSEPRKIDRQLVDSWKTRLNSSSFACEEEVSEQLVELLTEELRVEGRWALGLEAIQSMEIGKEQNIFIDIMLRNGRPSPYTPSEIRTLLLEKHSGVLPMVYELNALVDAPRSSWRRAVDSTSSSRTTFP